MGIGSIEVGVPSSMLKSPLRGHPAGAIGLAVLECSFAPRACELHSSAAAMASPPKPLKTSRLYLFMEFLGRPKLATHAPFPLKGVADTCDDSVVVVDHVSPGGRLS